MHLLHGLAVRLLHIPTVGLTADAPELGAEHGAADGHHHDAAGGGHHEHEVHKALVCSSGGEGQRGTRMCRSRLRSTVNKVLMDFKCF